MNKLIASVALRLGCSDAQARLVVDAVLLAIQEAPRCALRGFGTFTWQGERLVFRSAKLGHEQPEKLVHREDSGAQSS